MNSKPLISIIIPMYNVQDYIEKCLKSVIEQTYTNIEVLIIDDGSKDNSYNLAKQFLQNDNRIKIIQQENGGLSDARNTGIIKAKGDYLFFLDSDDYIPPYCIEYLYDLISSNKTKISIGAHTILKNKKSIYKGIGKNQIKVYSQKEILKEILYDVNVDLSAWAKLYKKELFKNIKYPKGLCFEDTATTYKLLYLCDKVSVGGNSVYFYNIRQNSITTKSDFSKKIQLIENTKEMCSSILEKYPDLEDYTNKRIVWSYFSTLNQYLKSNNKKQFKTDKNEIVKYLKSKKNEILKKEIYGKKEKFGIILLSLGLPIYNIVRKFV